MPAPVHLANSIDSLKLGLKELFKPEQSSPFGPHAKFYGEQALIVKDQPDYLAMTALYILQEWGLVDLLSEQEPLLPSGGAMGSARNQIALTSLPPYYQGVIGDLLNNRFKQGWTKMLYVPNDAISAGQDVTEDAELLAFPVLCSDGRVRNLHQLAQRVTKQPTYEINRFIINLAATKLLTWIQNNFQKLSSEPFNLSEKRTLLNQNSYYNALKIGEYFQNAKIQYSTQIEQPRGFCARWSACLAPLFATFSAAGASGAVAVGAVVTSTWWVPALIGSGAAASLVLAAEHATYGIQGTNCCTVWFKPEKLNIDIQTIFDNCLVPGPLSA